MGHVIRSWRLQTAAHTTIAIKELNLLRNMTDRNCSETFFTVFRRTVSNFARIVLPFSDKLQDDQPLNFELYKRELEAMNNFPEKLSAPLGMALR